MRSDALGHSVSVTAPAKINLHLEVVDRFPDPFISPVPKLNKLWLEGFAFLGFKKIISANYLISFTICIFITNGL